MSDINSDHPSYPTMKKFLSLLLVALAFTSCEDDVSFNNPSVQGEKDNVFWRASDYRASVAGGSLTVSAFTPYEILTLKTVSSAPGTYILGEDDLNVATYSIELDGATSTYTTGTDIGDGEIIIDAAQAAGTISGKFKFNAHITTDPLAGLVVNYQYGVFYRVPLQ